MQIIPYEGTMTPENAAEILAAGVVAEYGDRAADVARRQIEGSSGDVEVSWTLILDAILKQGRQEAP